MPKDVFNERTKKINAAIAEPIPSPHTVVAIEPKEVYVKPKTTKTFHDGSERKWDDVKQEWVVIK